MKTKAEFDNKALMETLRVSLLDGFISRAEAMDIVRDMNKLQATTREECITLLKEHGHKEVAERYNRLEFDQVLYTSSSDPKRFAMPYPDNRTAITKKELEQEVVAGIWEAAFPKNEKLVLPSPSLPRIRPRVKQRLIWSIIVFGPSILALLIKTKVGA